MLVARGCSKSTFFVVMTLAVLVPQEGVTQDIPEPQSLGRMAPAEAESDKKSDKLPEEFSNEALDATRKLGPIEIDGRIDEPDWEMAKVFTGFTAKEPIEGEPAKDDTEVRVLLGDGAVWIGAGVGVGVRLLPFHPPRGLMNSLFIGLGWVPIVVAPDLFRSLEAMELALVVVEGLLYSGGALMLGARWPDPSPEVFGYHEVWHALVTAAVGVHFLLVALLVAG